MESAGTRRAGTRRGRVAAVVVLAWCVSGGATRGADEYPMTLWHDRTFQRQFLGSYGVKAEIEPSVTAVEQPLLDQIAEVMGQKGGLKKAQQLIQEKGRETTSAVFDFTLGNIYFQQELLDAAAKAYARAVAKFPSYQRAHRNQGLVYIRNGKYEEGARALTRALELGAADGLTYGLLAYGHLMTERYAAAEGAYRQALVLQPDTVDWKLGLARCYFKQSKFADAAALCAELMAAEPERTDYWVLQANAYLGMKELSKAAENYEYLSAIGAATAPSLQTLGDLYVNQGLMDLAADAYLRAMAVTPPAPVEQVLRNGEVLAARGAYADAARIVAGVRAAPGETPEAPVRIRMLKLEARLAAARGDAAAEQARLLEDVIALDPMDGEALILLAQHHAAQGDAARSDFLFERAAGIESAEAEASLRHAQSLVRRERYADAVRLLKRAQELQPREDVARFLEQVERVARTKN